MTERPILFNGEMVRAILSGQKTVTRRACKPQPSAHAHTKAADGTPMGSWWETGKNINRCPYGQPGERLWVRESFTDLRGTGIEHRPDPAGPLQRYAFAADSPPGSHSDEVRKDYGIKWKPSIHMPRSACRILLEITAVRVERLQDISEEQARAEGITDGGCHNCGNHEPCGCECPTPSAVDSFVHLWNSTGGDWDANPWVWVVEFKRVMP